jgi:hypothetical protein
VLAKGSGAQLIWRQLLVRIPPKRIFFASLFALLLACLNLSAFEVSEHSVSPSGQFVIYGADAPYRGTISALAERIKANLLSVLKRRDAWKIAIVVNLRPRTVNLPELLPAELWFSQTETGVKLQFDLTVSQTSRPAAIERELARVILVEMIYRNQTGIAPGDVYVDPPAWLVDGLLASAPNRDRAFVASALSVPARADTLAEFLNQPAETLDSSARQLYLAYSFVLVELLIDSPNGRSHLGRYVDNLAFATNDPMANLRASFPEVRDFESLWKLKIADLKAAADKDLLTFSRTDEKLNELLAARFPSQDGHGGAVLLETFSRTRRTPAQRTALQEFSGKLLLLGTRANPILRPVIQDYQQIAGQLALGKNRGIEKRLADLKSLRTRLSARMDEVDDYMNWFEAAKLEAPSGIFDDYSQTTDSIRSQKPKRRDALSVYLDAMELEF